MGVTKDRRERRGTVERFRRKRSRKEEERNRREEEKNNEATPKGIVRFEGGRQRGERGQREECAKPIKRMLQGDEV